MAAYSHATVHAEGSWREPSEALGQRAGNSAEGRQESAENGPVGHGENCLRKH